MNPVDKSRRIDSSIHKSRFTCRWNEVAFNGIACAENLDSLLEELKEAVKASRKIQIDKTLYEVIYHIISAKPDTETLCDFLSFLKNEGYLDPAVRLPPNLENLIESLFDADDRLYSAVADIGLCLNQAGLYAAVKRGDKASALIIMNQGVVPSNKTLEMAAGNSTFDILVKLNSSLSSARFLKQIFKNSKLKDENVLHLLTNARIKISELDVIVLKTALERGFFKSTRYLLSSGLRFKTEPIQANIAHEKVDTRITRLFLRSVGYEKGGRKKEPFTHNFNLDVLIEAFADIDALSNTNLTRSSRTNPEIYFYILTKRVGTAWSLSGTFRNPAASSLIDMDGGFETVICYLCWLQGLVRFSRSNICSKVDFALQGFNEAIMEDYSPYFRPADFLKPRCILTGDDSHAFVWVVYKNFLIYGNRGFETGREQHDSQYGITILETPANFAFTEELFNWFVYTDKTEEEDAPYLDNVKKKTGCKEIIHFPMKIQEATKCTEVACKLATLIFFMIEEVDAYSKISKKDWIGAFNRSLPLYKDVTNHYRTYTLEGLLGELANWPDSQNSSYPIDMLMPIANKIINRLDRFGSSLNKVLAEINRLA